MAIEGKKRVDEWEDADFLSYLYSERERENSLSQYQGWNNWALAGAFITSVCAAYNIWKNSYYLETIDVVYYAGGVIGCFLTLQVYFYFLRRKRGIDVSRVRWLKEVVPIPLIIVVMTTSITSAIWIATTVGLSLLFWLWVVILVFLESEYGIPSEQICYIHGNRKDKFGSLVLGHHSDDQEAFERWKHKNQNRRRYRHVQKDKKGRYFRNDKLAYLAFFHENDWTGNWRLPIRYYAVEAAEERLEKYYDANFKNTRRIIDGHMGFFDSLGGIEKITVIGCSLGAVDMDYYKQLRSSVKDDALWEFSYHSLEDEKRIDKFCKELNIDTGCVSTFRM